MLSDSNPLEALVNGVRILSLFPWCAALSRFSAYFCYNFHFVPVIENHPISAHVAPVIRISKVASVRPRHPRSPRARCMEREHIVWIFIYRIAFALLTRSVFQPDEFFQSLEIAHNVVFGYGKLTWEWQPGLAIRSIAYPALYIPVYWILRATSLDATGLLVCEFPIIPNATSERVVRCMHQSYSMAQLQH